MSFRLVRSSPVVESGLFTVSSFVSASAPSAAAPAVTTPAAAPRKNFLRFIYHSYPLRGVISEEGISAGFLISMMWTSPGEPPNQLDTPDRPHVTRYLPSRRSGLHPTKTCLIGSCNESLTRGLADSLSRWLARPRKRPLPHSLRP